MKHAVLKRELANALKLQEMCLCVISLIFVRVFSHFCRQCLYGPTVTKATDKKFTNVYGSKCKFKRFPQMRWLDYCYCEASENLVARSKQLVMLLLTAILMFGSALGPALDLNDDDTPDNDIPEIINAVENHVVPKIDHPIDVATAIMPALNYLGAAVAQQETVSEQLPNFYFAVIAPPLVLRT